MSETPISDFIESSPNYVALKEQVDALKLQVEVEKANAAGWEEAFDRASESARDFQNRADDLESALEIEKAATREQATRKRAAYSDRGRLVAGMEALKGILNSNLTDEMIVDVVKTVVTGTLRDVNEE